jgi:hypothetical protein
MDPVTATIIGSILERLFVCCGGLLSMWLGFKLFSITVTDLSKAELSGHGLKFKAERIGPGVFFALFGAVLLLVSIVNPMSIKREDLGPIDKADAVRQPDATRSTAFRGAVPEPSAGVPAGLRAVNTLIQEFRSQPADASSLSGAGYTQAKAAVELLIAVQREYVDTRYGKGTFDIVLLMQRECQQTSSACTSYRADRAKADMMDKVLDYISTYVE